MVQILSKSFSHHSTSHCASPLYTFMSTSLTATTAPWSPESVVLPQLHLQGQENSTCLRNTHWVFKFFMSWLNLMMCLYMKICSLMFSGVFSRTGHQSHRAQMDSCVNIVCFGGQMWRAPFYKERLLTWLDYAWSPNANKQSLAKLTTSDSSF